MNLLDMSEIPSQGRLPFAWLDKRIIDCLECNKRIKTTRIRDLHKCPRCSSEKIVIIKKTRIPYRTLTQARDEGRLLVYPDNPTETNAMMLADWRSHPRTVKTNTANQIRKGATTHDKYNHTVQTVSNPATP